MVHNHILQCPTNNKQKKESTKEGKHKTVKINTNKLINSVNVKCFLWASFKYPAFSPATPFSSSLSGFLFSFKYKPDPTLN